MRVYFIDRPFASFRGADFPRAALCPGQSLVRIQASGLNPLDTKIRLGKADHAKQPSRLKGPCGTRRSESGSKRADPCRSRVSQVEVGMRPMNVRSVRIRSILVFSMICRMPRY